MLLHHDHSFKKINYIFNFFGSCGCKFCVWNSALLLLVLFNFFGIVHSLYECKHENLCLHGV